MTELLAAAIAILIGKFDGIQFNTYTKNGGAYALTLALETTVNRFAGYKNTDELMLVRDMVAFPLTSFRPASRNIISKLSMRL